VKPKRIQRKRTKGWKMPPNTIAVTRPGEFGNPFKVGHHYKRDCGFFVYLEASDGYEDSSFVTIKDAAEAVAWFRWYTERRSRNYLQRIKDELRSKDLACWCPLDQPCHADVLLEIANA
jgi:hypothetical protein